MYLNWKICYIYCSNFIWFVVYIKVFTIKYIQVTIVQHTQQQTEPQQKFTLKASHSSSEVLNTTMAGIPGGPMGPLYPVRPVLPITP